MATPPHNINWYAFPYVGRVFSLRNDNAKSGDDHLFTSAFFRFGAKAESKIDTDVKAVAQVEFHHRFDESTEKIEDVRVRLAYAGVDSKKFGSLLFGRQNGAPYHISAWTNAAISYPFGGNGAVGVSADQYGTGRCAQLFKYSKTFENGVSVAASSTPAIFQRSSKIPRPGYGLALTYDKNLTDDCQVSFAYCYAGGIVFPDPILTAKTGTESGSGAASDSSSNNNNNNKTNSSENSKSLVPSLQLFGARCKSVMFGRPVTAALVAAFGSNWLERSQLPMVPSDDNRPAATEPVYHTALEAALSVELTDQLTFSAVGNKRFPAAGENRFIEYVNQPRPNPPTLDPQLQVSVISAGLQFKVNSQLKLIGECQVDLFAPENPNMSLALRYDL
eukprot:gnl/Spiro4/399_TR217_c0_g1_i1.p1 gnl/Spiro4/399_TR217_c0_g1~~gnl/Spiro4/399_TR217_c0_g1_i1.p1  ORF type:complete len:402 (-),score=76.24 gnl/Spiro4/399_TR217_c0_g1_i1:41-1210(-)